MSRLGRLARKASLAYNQMKSFSLLLMTLPLRLLSVVAGVTTPLENNQDIINTEALVHIQD